MNDDRKGADVSEDVTIAQIVTAIITGFYAVVFAIGYYLLIKVNLHERPAVRRQPPSSRERTYCVQDVPRRKRKPMCRLLRPNTLTG